MASRNIAKAIEADFDTVFSLRKSSSGDKKQSKHNCYLFGKVVFVDHWFFNLRD
jgi:hypothetical protein